MGDLKNQSTDLGEVAAGVLMAKLQLGEGRALEVGREVAAAIAATLVEFAEHRPRYDPATKSGLIRRR